MDKDLKGHSCYSPETCVYLPKEINQCLQRHNGIKKSNGVWIAEYSRGGQLERIGGIRKQRGSTRGLPERKERIFGLFSSII